MTISSAASGALVEAYIPGAAVAPAGPVAAFAPALAAYAPGPPFLPFSARGRCQGTQPLSARLLEGDWAPGRRNFKPAIPEVATRRVAAELDVLARARRGAQEAQECLQPLSARRGGAGRASASARGRGAAIVAGSGSSVCSRSSASGAGAGGHAAAPAPSEPSAPASSRSLSHATTPSWRSRSFPPRPPQPGLAPGRPEADEAVPETRQRLPPLPMEARWAAAALRPGGVAPSELRHLEGIGSDVFEANALLVESFLNVKRWPPDAVGAPPSCSDGLGNGSSLPGQTHSAAESRGRSPRTGLSDLSFR